MLELRGGKIVTISPERERQLCSWSRYPSDALRAIQILIARVRELEAELDALKGKNDEQVAR